MDNKYFRKDTAGMKCLMQLLLLPLLGLPAFFANAADTEAVRAATPDMNFNAGLSGDSLLQVFTVLIFIVLLIFVLSVVLKKFNMLPGTSGKLIKIISGISLTNKDRLLLIQVGEEQVLISACPGNIQKIHVLATPVEIEDNTATAASEKVNFSGLLNSMIKRPRS